MLFSTLEKVVWLGKRGTFAGHREVQTGSAVALQVASKTLRCEGQNGALAGYQLAHSDKAGKHTKPALTTLGKEPEQFPEKTARSSNDAKAPEL